MDRRVFIPSPRAHLPVEARLLAPVTTHHHPGGVRGLRAGSGAGGRGRAMTRTLARARPYAIL